MSGKTIFVIEQGSYSDYQVVGVYSTRAAANQVRDALRAAECYGDSPEVAEWPLNPAVDELRQGLSRFRVVMLIDGTVERCDPSALSGYELAGSVQIWRRTQAAYKGKGIPDALMAVVWAKDAEHAIKIANEHRAEMKASGRWKP